MSLITNVLLVFCVFYIAVNDATDLQVGTNVNATLAYQERVKLGAILTSRRIKNVFYSSNNTKVIKGISAIELEQTKAVVNVTAGGIGHTFVNVKIQSERSMPLNYLVQIFI